MNIPLLPDKAYKLLIYLGVGLLIYCWLFGQNQSEQYEKKRIEFNVEIKKLENEQKYLNLDLKEISKEADVLSRKYSIENPLNVSDSGYIFNRTLRGSKTEVRISDSIATLLQKYNFKQTEISKKNDQLGIKKYELESLSESISSMNSSLILYVVLGFTFTIVGIISWDFKDEADSKLLMRLNLDKPTFSNLCQSCGKKFNSMIKYGKEKDSSFNYHFCRDCYSDGEFTNQELTKDEIKDKRKNEMIAKGRKKISIKIVSMQIDNLDRWN